MGGGGKQEGEETRLRRRSGTELVSKEVKRKHTTFSSQQLSRNYQDIEIVWVNCKALGEYPNQIRRLLLNGVKIGKVLM